MGLWTKAVGNLSQANSSPTAGCAFRQYLLFNSNKIIILLCQGFFCLPYTGHLKITNFMICIYPSENWENKWIDKGHITIKWLSQGLPQAVWLWCQPVFAL